MGIRLTMDVFSGRPNPTVEVTGRRATEVLAGLAPEGHPEEDVGLPDFEPLGYRGVVVEGTGSGVEQLGRLGLPRTFRVVGKDLVGRNLARRAADTGVTDALLAADGPFAAAEGVDARFFETLPRLVADFERTREKLRGIVPLLDLWLRPICQGAPPSDLAWWNAPARCPYNNCYNYGSNYRTDTFAQPGLGAGAMYTEITGAAVRKAAIRDELVDAPDADGVCPATGHLVALVIAPGWDFHWYRKGRNSRWSHKPGGTPATGFDNSGALVLDPRTADRGMYTEFITFMVAVQGHIKIA
jgi:hypothetical protein